MWLLTLVTFLDNTLYGAIVPFMPLFGLRMGLSMIQARGMMYHDAQRHDAEGQVAEGHVSGEGLRTGTCLAKLWPCIVSQGPPPLLCCRSGQSSAPMAGPSSWAQAYSGAQARA